jgi:hypothetical protein
MIDKQDFQEFHPYQLEPLGRTGSSRGTTSSSSTSFMDRIRQLQQKAGQLATQATESKTSSSPTTVSYNTSTTRNADPVVKHRVVSVQPDASGGSRGGGRKENIDRSTTYGPRPNTASQANNALTTEEKKAIQMQERINAEAVQLRQQLQARQCVSAAQLSRINSLLEQAQAYQADASLVSSLQTMAMYPLCGDEQADPRIAGLDIPSWAMYAAGGVLVVGLIKKSRKGKGKKRSRN